MCELFVTMYKTWCHRPVAALTLCLLAGRYEQAALLIEAFRGLHDTDIITDLDVLAQRIECSVFTPLRIHLLNPNCNQFLLRTLYCLLDLIPRSEATDALSLRLETVSTCPVFIPDYTGPKDDGSSQELQDQFQKVYSIHQFYSRSELPGNDTQNVCAH